MAFDGFRKIRCPFCAKEKSGIARFKAARYMAVYLQVYFAIPDYTRQPPTWFYSDGFEPGSKTAAYYSGPDTKVI